MRKLWRFIARVVFWSYERGSLPYDLMVLAILVFVLLTPRKWYRDQPHWNADALAGQVQLIGIDPAGHTEVFRVDADLLTPPQRTPALEQASHALLSRSVSSLRGQSFQIVQIQPVRDPSGTVIGYDVRIKPLHGAPR